MRRDPQRPREHAFADNNREGPWDSGFETVSALGMTVFFGCLLINGDSASESPAWLIWPAFVLMTVGFIGRLVLGFGQWYTSRQR